MANKKTKQKMEKRAREYQLKADLLKKYFVENDYLEDFFTTVHEVCKVSDALVDSESNDEILKANLVEHFIDWAEHKQIKFYDFSEVEIKSIVDKNFQSIQNRKYSKQELNGVTQCEHLFEVLNWNGYEEPSNGFFDIYIHAFDLQNLKNDSGVQVYYGIKPLGHFLEDINLTKNTIENLSDETDSELFFEASV